MEKTWKENVYWVIFFGGAILFALLISGCHRMKQPASTSSEGKKEAPEAISAPRKADQPQEQIPSEPSAPTPPSSSTTLPSVPGPSQEEISSGAILLNPEVPQDAKIIQVRLAELRLYTGPVDGIWGRGSRAALKAFKQQNSFGSSDVWDKEAQLRLFSETGAAGQSGSRTTQEQISSGSTLLNPEAPLDAKTIQIRLAEIGLYKGPIDGIWGKASRTALKTFKEQNSLENPDKWDRETQMLLFGKPRK